MAKRNEKGQFEKTTPKKPTVRWKKEPVKPVFSEGAFTARKKPQLSGE